MYPVRPRPQKEYDWSRAAERAIDLSISSGLFLAPRLVLLDMAARLKKQSEEVHQAELAEQIEHLRAA